MATRFAPFDRNVLPQVLTLSRGDSAVCYLLDYLEHLGAQTCIIEQHYVDRHYLDDYAGYYARSFQATPSACSRVHFFADTTPAQVQARFIQAFASSQSRGDLELFLQERYLGFVVLRPLPSARIGRAVLRTFPADGGRRHYPVVRPYPVHLVGLRLRIEGLAYQQQDGGAAVCASTALWVALQRVAHVVGHRSPTPFQITEAAGSPYPASAGLEEIQMARALSKLGYIADKFAPANNRPLFRALLVAALDSQLPVILLVTRKQKTGSGEIYIGHAVTVTGYSEPATSVEIPSVHLATPTLNMRSGSVDVLYVHDDNLGFHAHYELQDSDEVDAYGYKKLCLIRGRTTATPVKWWDPDKWDVTAALVPKPPKLRLPVNDLLTCLYPIRSLLEEPLPGQNLQFSAAFSTGVDVQRKLLGAPFWSQVAPFLTHVDLPRHVGVLRAYGADGSVPYDAENPLCEFIVDVTEVARNRGLPRVLAFLGHGIYLDSAPGKSLISICQRLNWPCMFRQDPPAVPPTPGP